MTQLDKHPVFIAEEWDDSLLLGLPESLLRWFSCDCAERAMRREEAMGRTPDPRLVDAVNVSRRFSVGRSSYEDLNNARGEARDVLDNITMPHSSQAELASYYASKAAVWASDLGPIFVWYAASLTANCAARNAVYCGKGPRKDEKRWQLRRLRGIVDIWGRCGFRPAQRQVDGGEPVWLGDYP